MLASSNLAIVVTLGGPSTKGVAAGERSADTVALLASVRSDKYF